MSAPLENPVPPTLEPRSMCGGCGRPSSVCLCASVSRVSTRTRVVILQHPRESAVPIGTARLAELGLPNAERHVGVDFSAAPRVREILADTSAPPILLFPGEGARDLESAPPEGPVTLIVIDGTWSQAGKLVKANPAIAALPRYTFAPEEPSRYRIRRAPTHDFVSTIEAIVEALSYLEGNECDLSPVLGPFDAMVEHQLAFIRANGSPRHKLRKKPRPPFWPEALTRRADDLIVGYAEANAWPRGTPLGATPEIVHVVLERLLDGSRFEALIRPRLPLSPSFTFHTGIAEEAVLAGESWSSFTERFGEFVGSSSVLASWGYFWTDALRREGLVLPERLDLRDVARRWLRRGPGTLESCLESVAAPNASAWAPGRTGHRAALILALARRLRSVALDATVL
jgi:DTW domain-containing protein